MNDLINETSVYLLDHAHNPVDWMPYSNKAFKKAVKEKKLVIISIGYSSCHWCHVMERETFSNKGVAKVMNDNFISIKVDREELPDVDNKYMTSAQIMNSSTGWPLNCIALPSGDAIWCGTYLNKDAWIEVLNKINNIYKNNYELVLESAKKIDLLLQQYEELKTKKTETNVINKEFANSLHDIIYSNFDTINGGLLTTPKFIIPSNYNFMMAHFYRYKKSNTLKMVDFSLEKIALGGIYDKAEGGFFRYSTDNRWKVPHFEKMLYDNAQLLTTYSKAFQLTKKPIYKQVVYQTIDFLKKTMLSPQTNLFYSSINAESEGKEGEYYLFSLNELHNSNINNLNFFLKFFNITPKEAIEKDKFILFNTNTFDKFKSENNITPNQIDMNSWKKSLIDIRKNKIAPRIDHKFISSWNAILMSGFIDAYNAFGDPSFLDLANEIGNFFVKKIKANGINHIYNQNIGKIDPYLEDYANLIQGFIKMYQSSFEKKWLSHANKLTKEALDKFYNKKTKLFYFKDKNSSDNTTEVTDDVIPSSNSIMAENLFLLSNILFNQQYNDIANNMVKVICNNDNLNIQTLSNWARLKVNMTNNFYQIAVVGEKATELSNKILSLYIPNKTLMTSIGLDESLEIFKNKYKKGKTLIYVCLNKVCKRPTESLDKALNEIR